MTGISDDVQPRDLHRPDRRAVLRQARDDLGGDRLIEPEDGVRRRRFAHDSAHELGALLDHIVSGRLRLRLVETKRDLGAQRDAVTRAEDNYARRRFDVRLRPTERPETHAVTLSAVAPLGGCL